MIFVIYAFVVKDNYEFLNKCLHFVKYQTNKGELSDLCSRKCQGFCSHQFKPKSFQTLFAFLKIFCVNKKKNPESLFSSVNKSDQDNY